MFLNNKYTVTYFKLMERSKNRSISVYTEKHHIIPRSMGGDNSKDNIAILTAREHFIAHRLLVKMTIGDNKRKMCLAMSMFLTTNKNHQRIKINSHTFKIIREQLSLSMKGVKPSKQCRDAVSRVKKGKALSDSQKQKISKSLRRSTSFYACSPSNVLIQHPDLLQWCSQHGQSYHTIIKKITNTPYVITAGHNKGWIFSLALIVDCDIIRNKALEVAHLNRSRAISSIWNNRHASIH